MNHPRRPSTASGIAPHGTPGRSPAIRPRRVPRISAIALAALAAALSLVSPVRAQNRPYIGYTYPAGGQQGTTFNVKLGGQALDDVQAVRVTGTGVSGRVVRYYRRLNPQETQLLNEQLRALKRTAPGPSTPTNGATLGRTAPPPAPTPDDRIARIEERLREYVQTPACAALASLVFAEITVAPGAAPGPRELRLVTPRGISNPLVFQVGQLPETTRTPLLTAPLQILGKEAAALRRRPARDLEQRLDLPVTANGQIASGEVHRYRFAARRDQRLVFITQARQLTPFIADAVPGWCQPTLSLHDNAGRELAFVDDDQFRPDPVLRWQVPKDGEYVVAIADALYRGREDFVYRLTIGEVPLIASIFPLGARAGSATPPALTGWNLDGSVPQWPGADAAPGVHWLTATGRNLVSAPVPFAVDDLPELLEREPNDSAAEPQPVTLPVIVNGRLDRPGDDDVFRFIGHGGDSIAVEVLARRLDSPLDALVRLTDDAGQLLAFSDDREDLGAGLHTHQADPWLMATLPADGSYRVHIGDIARQGGLEYGYRLRLSPPRPDFQLRVTPSSLGLRTNSSGSLTVYAQRRDGFAGSIRLELRNPPPGFSAAPVKLARGETMTRIIIRGPSEPTAEPVTLAIVGRATVNGCEIVREAVPAEDRMQAFLWRQLVPARDLPALAFAPPAEPASRRGPGRRPLPAPSTNAVVMTAAPTNAPAGTNAVPAAAPKFSPSQVARRLRELSLLFEEGLLTEEFYEQKVAECELPSSP